jgi:hypothetical protein
MPRRGRPAQGHAPAEGVTQYDMAHLFVADAERPNPGSGATRMVVEWLVNRGSGRTPWSELGVVTVPSRQGRIPRRPGTGGVISERVCACPPS